MNYVCIIRDEKGRVIFYKSYFYVVYLIIQMLKSLFKMGGDSRYDMIW